LALVVLFVIEEPISPNAASRNAIKLLDFHDRILTGGLVVVIKEVVAGRNE
jgi:hypothetical protein